MVSRPSALARRMMFGRVEMMPSALVLCAMKSAVMSRAVRPSMRSAWTKTILPACLTRSTCEAMSRIVPYRKNTVVQSLAIAFSSPSSLLSAAITGQS